MPYPKNVILAKIVVGFYFMMQKNAGAAKYSTK